MDNSGRKTSGQKRDTVIKLIAGMLIVAVYEAVLALIAKDLLKKDRKDR